MTRRGCTCSSCTRNPGSTVRGGTEVRCPNGHDSVRLTHGHDGRGKFLQAMCTEPGCGAKQLVRQVAA
jgi:hypothetical protein